MHVIIGTAVDVPPRCNLEVAMIKIRKASERGHVNQGWLDYTGMTAEQARGWRWAEAIHADDRKKLVEEWQSCLASGTPVDTEARIRRFDSSY